MAAQRGPKQRTLPNLCAYSPRKPVSFESALISSPSVSPSFQWRTSWEWWLQMTSLSSSVFPYSPTKEGHCLPLTCILLEIIIFTSMTFQIVDHISAQKSILIFLCFSVACKGHKYRTDYLRKKKTNKIFALLFCCILLGNTKLFSHSSWVMCIFWCPIPPLWWAWKDSMVLQYLRQVHLCISFLCKPQAQESLGNA